MSPFFISFQSFDQKKTGIIQKIRLFFFVCVDWKRFDRLPRTEYGEVCKFRYFTGKRKTCGKLSRLRRIYIWLSIQWRPRLSIHFCMEFCSLYWIFLFLFSIFWWFKTWPMALHSRQRKCGSSVIPREIVNFFFPEKNQTVSYFLSETRCSWQVKVFK
jgi:hypothetical protein